MTVKLLFF